MTATPVTGRPPTWDIPAVHIEKPICVPSTHEVQTRLAAENEDSDIVTLVTVGSGDAEVGIVRFEWAGDNPRVGVDIRVHQPGNDIAEYIDPDDDGDPVVIWRRLTELANAASVAADQLLTMIVAGSWK